MPAILPYYNGRPVIVDDECPYDDTTGVAGITLFAKGAIAHNDIARAKPFEPDRNAKANADDIISHMSRTNDAAGYTVTRTLTHTEYS